MARKRKAAYIGGGLFAALLLFIAFALPPIVRNKAMEAVQSSTGRTLDIGAVRINPLTWSAEVRNVRLSEKGHPADTFAAADSIRISVSPSSLWRLAPVLRRVEVGGPYLHIVRTGPNRYNFSDLLEKKKDEEKPGKPVHFSLNNIIISDGTIIFADDALKEPTVHTVRNLRLQVPFISNIPYMVDRYVDPYLSAVVNGAPFTFTGKMKPFAKGLEASVTVDLKELDLPHYAAYIPASLPVSVVGGRLSTKLEVTHRLSTKGKPDLTLAGTIGLDGLDLRLPGNKPFVALQRVEMRIARAGLLSGRYSIDSLSITGPDIRLARDRAGTMNYAVLMAKKGTEEKAAEKPTPDGEKKPFDLSLGRFTLSNGTVRLRDDVPKGGFTEEVKKIALSLTGFATAGGRPADCALFLETGRGEKLTVGGTVTAAPAAAALHVSWDGIVLEALYPYLANELTAPVAGRLSGATDISYDETAGPRLAGLGLQLRNLAVPFGPGEGAKLPLLEVKGGALDLNDRQATLEEVILTKGSVILSRDDKGKLSPLTLLVVKQQGPAGKPAATPPKTAGKPFNWLVRRIGVRNLNVEFTDRTRKEKPTFALHRLNADLSGLAGPIMKPMPFRLVSGYGNSGRIKGDGRIDFAPFSLDGNLAVSRIPILDADPYLPANLNIVLADGAVDAAMKVRLAAGKDGTLSGSFSGSAGVRQFYSLDAVSMEDLLKWESLQFDGISGRLSPFSLRLAGVSLDNFYARIIVNRDGVLNLQQIQGKAAAPAAGKPEAAPATAAAPPPLPQTAATPAGPPPVQIDAVTLQGGTLFFTDRHLKSEFDTTMYNLGGRISGLSSAPGAYADVDLRGNLENQSPLTITGRINPLRGDLYADLKVRFADIELAPATPYSGTYLGYGIDRGKLTLDLKYLIDKKKLDAENKVIIDQFTFGRKIESDRATNLPVRLAVALLKDRQGVISLDLPVSGRTDDPQFSVWGVVWKILKNLLVKAATSPFALLSSMFGGGEDFSAVTFAPGSSTLTPGDATKLQALAKAFHDRPALKLDVEGFVDRDRDAEGYRNELLLKRMKAEKFLALAKEKKIQPGQTAENVEITAADYPIWLKEVYKKAKFPKPRNFIGMLKDIPDAEMKKLILANTTVGDAELKTLVRDRVTAVRTYLVKDAKLEPERVFEKGGNIYQPPKEEGKTASRVEFGLVAP